MDDIRINWATNPPTLAWVGEGEDRPIGVSDDHDRLRDILGNARDKDIRVQDRRPDDTRTRNWTGIGNDDDDLDRFLDWVNNDHWERLTGQDGNPIGPFRNILGSIAVLESPEERAAAIAQFYEVVRTSGGNDAARSNFLQATQFVGAYIIEMGGDDAEALDQLNHFWNALDAARSMASSRGVAMNGEIFLEAYMAETGLDRGRAEAALTQMALVSGHRLLQDGVPMDQFNDILGNILFDDSNVAIGTQLMLGLVHYDSLPAGHPWHDLNTQLADDPALQERFEHMCHDFAALMEQADHPDFPVYYAMFMDEYAVDVIGPLTEREPPVITVEQMDALLTDAQMQLVADSHNVSSPAELTDDQVGETAVETTDRAVLESSANSMHLLYDPITGERRRFGDIEGTYIDESEPERLDAIEFNFERWTELADKVMEFLDVIFGLTEPQQDTVMALDPNGDGKTIGDRYAEVQGQVSVDEPEVVLVDDGPERETVPEPQVNHEQSRRALTDVMQRIYPGQTDSFFEMSVVFAHGQAPAVDAQGNIIHNQAALDGSGQPQRHSMPGQPLNNVDGIYQDLIQIVLNGHDQAEARALLNAHLAEPNLTYMMEFIYDAEGNIRAEAQGAVADMMEESELLASMYGAQAALANSGVSITQPGQDTQSQQHTPAQPSSPSQPGAWLA